LEKKWVNVLLGIISGRDHGFYYPSGVEDLTAQLKRSSPASGLEWLKTLTT
jgi:hypothetical protein